MGNARTIIRKMEWTSHLKTPAEEDATRRSDHSKEFSLSKIWGGPDSEEGRTEHKLVTSIGLRHSRHQSFKKPVLFPVFFPSRRAATLVTEPPQQTEEVRVSALSVPVTLPPRSTSPHGRVHGLHRRSSQPNDLLAVVHTDPGELTDFDANPEVPGRRVTTTAATNLEEEPQGLFECHVQEFSYEESVRAGRGDMKMEASLDFGDK